jgi:hypothetical protein
MVAYAFGARGDSLLAIVLLGTWPTTAVLAFVTARIFPPDVEPTGDFHGVLYGLTRADDLTAEPAFHERSDRPSQPSSRSVDGVDEPHAFALRDEPRSLEGVVLRGAAIVLLLSVVWMAGLPLVRRLVPGLETIQTEPAVFPITLRRGDDALAFTNGSTEAWTCRATLGFSEAYASVFPIEAHETHVVSYGDFQAAGRRALAATARDAARERVSVTCAEPSGRTHFWRFN